MNIKKTFSFFVVICLLSSTNLFADEGKSSLAVAEIKNTSGKAPNSFVVALDGILIEAISNTRKFNLVDRSRWKDLQKEQSFSDSGEVDLNDESRAQFGKIAGAKYLLLPDIIEFSDKLQQINYEKMQKTIEKKSVSLTLNVRIVDSSTGKIVSSATVSDAKTGNGDLLTEVSKSVAEQTAQRVIDVIYPAKVLSVIGSQVIFNRAIGGGFNEGDFIAIYAVGKELIDPDTQESLGKEEILVADAQVFEVDSKFSKAEIKGDNLGVQKGNIIKHKTITKPDVVENRKDKSKKKANNDEDW